MTDFDEKLTQALQTLGDGVEHLTEHDPLRMQLADTLRLLVPQDGGHMLILEEWDHPAALRSQITEWLAGSLEEGRESLPKHRRVFPGEGRRRYVLARPPAGRLLADHRPRGPIHRLDERRGAHWTQAGHGHRSHRG